MPLIASPEALPVGETIDVDVCILGAGAAGITLARELVDTRLSVCLLESGGLNPRREDQALYQGEVVGTDYHALERCRLRFFGGTTNHWGGTCRPLDPIDFEQRSWVPHSGWPLSRNELLPYYERAQGVCELGPLAYETADWPSLRPLPTPGGELVTRLFQKSPPTRFGARYRRDLMKAGNVTTFLRCNAVELATNDTASVVTRVLVATLDGARFEVAAKTVVLALGAIENARLLLASNRAQHVGLGNRHDLVGRYFMEHPYVIAASAVLDRGDWSPDLYTQQKVGGQRLAGFLTLSPETQRKHELLNFGMTLYAKGKADTSNMLSDVVEGIEKDGEPEAFSERLSAALSNLSDAAADYYRHLVDQDAYHLMHWMETTPNRDNRVTLDPQTTDALGMNRVRLRWQISTDDIASMRRAYGVVGAALGRAGVGRVKLEFDEGATSWGPSQGWGCHHIGTTRMHDDAKQGVVDRDCRVHGVANLFVAGSSVFPTSGAANPTLSLIALALRLADRLKDRPA
jgi:choline dehydrogenase-like flavoprotein